MSWDADGDLDVWISNRNAPRLRIMRNNESDNNNSLALPSSEPTRAKPTQTARVVAVTLLKGPRLQIRNNSGGIVTPGVGKPVLVNLFASWCPACVVELTEFRNREADIRGAGIEIISLSVDGLRP